MIFMESRLTDEYLLKDNLYAFIRVYHTIDKLRVDLSLYEKYIECDELHVYSEVLDGKCPTPALARVYGIIADADNCEKLWVEHRNTKISERSKNETNDIWNL